MFGLFYMKSSDRAGKVWVDNETYLEIFNKVLGYFKSRYSDFRPQFIEDLIQDAFIAAWHYMQSGNVKFNNEDYLPGYIFIKVRSMIRNFLRNGKHSVYKVYGNRENFKDKFYEEWSEDFDQNQQTSFYLTEILMDIETCLEDIDALDYRIIHHRIFDKRKFSEIAELENISLSKAKMRYKRALGRIRKKFFTDL